jgi:hypothetical protein
MFLFIMVFGTSVSDILYILERVRGFISNYEDAPEELRTLESVLSDWGSCLEALERTLVEVKKPTCSSFSAFKNTLKEAKAKVDEFKALQDERTTLGKRLLKTAKFQWDKDDINRLIENAKLHITVIHVYSNQIMM